MVNEVILVGKIVREPILSQTGSGHKVGNVVIETIRHFKNSYGIYESDYLEVTLWRGMAQTICDTCKKGSWLAVKGRVQTRNIPEEENRSTTKVEIVAEKVMILDSYMKS